MNTLGGVEVCLSKPAKEEKSGIDLPAGRQTIKGDQALAFVRQRYGLPGGDLDRIRRQQQFIGAIVRKVISAGTLLNPLKLNSTVNIATKSISIDESLTNKELLQLAQRFSSFSAGGVLFSTVPVAGAARRERQDVLLLDEAPTRADVCSRPRRPATRHPEARCEPRSSEQPARRPGQHPGEGLQRHRHVGARPAWRGRTCRGRLPGRRPARQPRYERHDDHRATRSDQGRLGPHAGCRRSRGAKIELDPTLGSTLEVVLGSAYSGAKQVTVSGQAPKPTSSASPQVRTAAQDPCAP